MSGYTPGNPTKAPNIPTGPRATPKTSPSKVMKPMPKASGTVMGKNPPKKKTAVNPKNQGQTVHGGPKR